MATIFHKILKQHDPDLRMSGDVKKSLEKLVHLLVKKIVVTAIYVTSSRDSKTIQARDIQTAVRIDIDENLAKYSMTNGNRAVVKYLSFQNKKGKKTSANTKSGLIIQPSKIRSHILSVMKNYMTDGRLSDTAPVYLTGVIEYLLSEIISLAVEVTKKRQAKMIGVDDVKKAVHEDESLQLTLCSLQDNPFG